MRLFERINRREVRLRSAVADSELLSFTDLRQAVRGSVRVTADECAAWCAEDTEQWRSAEQNNPYNAMGPLRLPFDSVWLEWRYPKTPQTDRTNFAAWITAEPPDRDAPGGCAQILTLLLFMGKTASVTYPPVATFVYVGEHGEAIGLAASSDPHGDTAVAARSRLIPAFVAIGLMNCRNTEVTETLPASSSGKAKRAAAGTPAPLSHHVISLPSPSRPRTVSQARSAAGGAVPLHHIRGHFKTYTADAPLLGKHVGTYWWRPAVRGFLANGRINASYRVSPPAPAPVQRE